jgi:hypothetical protein
MTTVPADDMARLLTALRDQYGGSVDAVMVAAEKGSAAAGRRRRLPGPVHLWTAGEVLDAVRMKLVTATRRGGSSGFEGRARGRAARVTSAPERVTGGSVESWRTSA